MVAEEMRRREGPPAVLDDFPRDLASATANEVAGALAHCRRGAVISVLRAGR